MIGPELAKTIVKTFLESEFQGGASSEKVALISEIEAGYLR